MPQKPSIPIEPANYYHLLNRGVNRRLIFQEPADYRKFLALVEHHVMPIGQVYSYALMPDHWHLTVGVNPVAQLPPHRLKDKHSISRVFGHLQNAYAKYYNNKYRTVSGLFERKFERYHVDTLDYLKALIIYHHFNPQKHNFIATYKNYHWSSYKSLAKLADSPLLDRECIWSKFGGFSAFMTAHTKYDERFWNKIKVE